MAIFNLVNAGQNRTTPFSTNDFSNSLPVATQMLSGAHILNVNDSGRLLTTNQSAAIGLFNPKAGGGYLATATFTFTLNVNGIVDASGLGSAGVVLGNTKSVAANKITVGKNGAIGGDDVGVYAFAVTNIDNNGVISAGGDGGYAIVLNAGDEDGTNFKPTSIVTINNNLGAVIGGENSGIIFNTLGKMIINNKGFIVGGEATSNNEGAANAVLSYDGAIVLTNDVNGVVDGTVKMGWLGSSVTNKGNMYGTINAHLYMEESESEEHGLTGFIDLDRDGTPAKLDLGDKHINTVVLTATTVTNTGTIEGTANWRQDDNGNDIQVALDMTRGIDKVINSGRIFGQIRTDGGNDSLDNAATGKIYGDVRLGGDTFYSSINEFTNDADILTNKGYIDGSVEMEIGKDTVTNSGEITGELQMGTGRYSAANQLGEDADTLTNTGTIRGNVWMGLGDDTVTNSGLLNDGLNTSAWAPATWNGTSYTFLNDTASVNKDFDNDKDKITNTGTIRGGIGTGIGADVVTNSGTVVGDIETGTWATRGRSSDPNNPFAAVDQSKFQADDNDTVTNSGSVQGEIWTGLGADIITNSGNVEGIYASSDYIDRNGNLAQFFDEDDPELSVTSSLPVDAAVYDKDTVSNSGTVRDEIWTGVGNDIITNTLTGRIMGGGIFGDDGADTITNAGYVRDDVHGGKGSDTITNSGVIGFNVLLGTGTGDTNKLVNTKTIGGDVAGDYGPDGRVAAQGSNTIENSGVILGNVTLGSGTDIVKNLGLGHIEGDITLGAGNDTFLGNASAEYIVDGDGGDTYTFGAGNDSVEFAAISLTQQVDGDADTIDGGLGTDIIDFSALTVNSIVNLSNALSQTIVWSNAGAFNHTDNLKNFENINTGSGNDRVTGTAGINYISAGDGTNFITGGGAQDVLSGGTGVDTFIFTALTDSAAGAADIITNFEVQDKFDISFITNLVNSTTFTVGSLINAQWHSTQVGGNTIVELNTDADAAAEFTIFLAGYEGIISATNFV
jgi:hypothetical protein